MSTDRREFLGALVGSGLVLDGKAVSRYVGNPAPPTDLPSSRRSDWDVTWADRIKGAHRAVFDSPEISQGLALLRTLIWFNQYKEVYGTAPADMSAVVVLRHNAIWMIMNDEFWDHHAVGTITKINDPKTGKPIRRNPWLGPTPFADLPADVMDGVFRKTLAAATILACNLAFQDVVENVKTHDTADDAKARTMALAHVVPGVLLQPSGVFAVTRAQEAGCQYLLAS